MSFDILFGIFLHPVNNAIHFDYLVTRYALLWLIYFKIVVFYFKELEEKIIGNNRKYKNL